MEVNYSKMSEKWQKKWKEKKVFQSEANKKKKKYYIAIVYPYMSGLLHLGHLFTYTFSEVLSRYKRMNGFNVLVKFGFHCTGTPIVAAAQRIKEKESTQIKTLKKMGIKEKEIPKFSEPEYWTEYFPEQTIIDLDKMGFAIDERYLFKTTSLNPPYDKFIRWQFNKLKESGYIKKGKHPVVWCPKDNAPTGDHARAEGEGETPQELLLIKHKLNENKFLVSATLRQDTILGTTNLFVNPEAEYCKAEVDKEQWIIGKECVKHLKQQDFNVKITGKIKGKELIGKKVEVFGKRKVLILPAFFLDPKVGTGLVHSVPSDSADDLIALKDLQKDEETCRKYKLDIEEIRKIKPIAVLNTPEYGCIPAEEMLKKYNVKSQKEKEKLEKIKKELYKLTHYTATMNKSYNSLFSENLEGKKVEEAKEVIKKDLIEKEYAVKYYELTGKVICRCLTECIVKVVSDQWFIEYNNSEWKKTAHKCLNKMKIYPEQTKKQLNYVIDWLNRWACVREFGLGTKLPWNEKWVIESLSDSTIQMAYNTISKYLQHPEEHGFKTDKLNDKFFDYIYLGKGKIKDVEKSTGIPKEMIETMRKDFNYWYPFDFRNSAKDLVQNHLAFCIFNHTALFQEKHWPKAFSLNGRIMVENEKMSKSKGNFFTIRELYEEHGADAVRLTSTNAGEGIDDANYDIKFLEIARKKINEMYEFAKKNYNKGRKEKMFIDDWFESVINKGIKETTENIENIKLRSAVKTGFLDMQRNLKWYLKRTNNNPKKELITEFIEIQTKLMAPITPHICEEIWETIGKKEFVSLASWPKHKEKTINSKLDKMEELIKQTLEDIKTIKKLVKTKPKKIHIYVADKWKQEAYKILIKVKDREKIIPEIMKNPEIRKQGKNAIQFCQELNKTQGKPPKILSREEEYKSLKEALSFIGKETETEVFLWKEEDTNKYDPQKKSKQAKPIKPAIYLE